MIVMPSFVLHSADLENYIHRGQTVIRACIRCPVQHVCAFVLHSPGAGCPENSHVRLSPLLHHPDMNTCVHFGQRLIKAFMRRALNHFSLLELHIDTEL